jgi:predicted Zn-ribbon and HTH transcriptional regulator
MKIILLYDSTETVIGLLVLDDEGSVKESYVHKDVIGKEMSKINYDVLKHNTDKELKKAARILAKKGKLIKIDPNRINTIGILNQDW